MRSRFGLVNDAACRHTDQPQLGKLWRSFWNNFHFGFWSLSNLVPPIVKILSENDEHNVHVRPRLAKPERNCVPIFGRNRPTKMATFGVEFRVSSKLDIWIFLQVSTSRCEAIFFFLIAAEEGFVGSDTTS